MTQNMKGMSQVLGLIVGAAVLMMTAMTLIFLTQGSLVDLFEDSDREACLQAVESACSAGGDTQPAPHACEDGDTWMDVPGSNSIDTDGTLNCG